MRSPTPFRAGLLACVLSLALLVVAAHSNSELSGGGLYSQRPLAADDPSLMCTGCQAVLQRGYELSQNSTEVAWLSEQLKAMCRAGQPDWGGLCELLAGFVAQELPKLPALLYKGGVYSTAIGCSIFGLCRVRCCDDERPTQIHLSAAGSLGDSHGAMHVTWITASADAEKNVRWGSRPELLDSFATASTRSYKAGGWVGAVHQALMGRLPFGATVWYQVGGDRTGWSSVRSFRAPQRALDTPFSFLVTGDMGAEKNYSGANQDWINYASAGKDRDVAIDAVLHIGDISYADGYMERWDQLFTSMEPTASQMPYMTVPGNHELLWNFTSYRTRLGLSMPWESSAAPADGLYYSWDVGCVHFVAINSESEINTPYVSDAQVAWLERDLAQYSARRAAGRRLRFSDAVCSYDAPRFLVAYMHRPLYCSQGSSNGRKRCIDQGAYLRGCVEKLLVQHGADVVFAGHVHAYERTTRLYADKPTDAGFVHILNGAGGNREGFDDTWREPLPEWSVARSPSPGLGYLRVLNGTALGWSFYLQTELQRALQTGEQPEPLDSTVFYARQ